MYFLQPYLTLAIHQCTGTELPEPMRSLLADLPRFTAQILLILLGCERSEHWGKIAAETPYIISLPATKMCR